MSWAKLYKTSSWHQGKPVLLLGLEKDNLALLQQGEVLEQEIYNDLDTVLLIHQWPQTPAQKPTPNKAKQNSSLFFRFFHFFSLFSLFFAFFTFFSLFFAKFLFRFDFFAKFLLILPSFLLQFFGVSQRSESCFASKGNKIFASISNFASEAKVRAHPSVYTSRCSTGLCGVDSSRSSTGLCSEDMSIMSK